MSSHQSSLDLTDRTRCLENLLNMVCYLAMYQGFYLIYLSFSLYNKNSVVFATKISVYPKDLVVYSMLFLSTTQFILWQHSSLCFNIAVKKFRNITVCLVKGRQKSALIYVWINLEQLLTQVAHLDTHCRTGGETHPQNVHFFPSRLSLHGWAQGPDR